MIKLYDYYRSSTSYRVRIALNWKNIPYDIQPIHLVKDGGEQHLPDYVKLNPLHRVPTLVDGDIVLTQSLAIIEYLEEQYPDSALLSDDAIQRAHIREVAQLIACDIHPLNNLTTLQYLQKELNVNDEQKTIWYRHWIANGFKAVETLLNQNKYDFCCADKVTLADVCLVPQVYNAYRFECDMKDFPRIEAIYQRCLELTAFKKAAPNQA